LSPFSPCDVGLCVTERTHPWCSFHSNADYWHVAFKPPANH
jgi:hypothetical protein